VLQLIVSIVHKRSSELLRNWRYGNWRNRQDRVIMKKYGKSCKVLAMKCGFFYVFNFKKVFAYINFIFWGAAKVVIANNYVSRLY